MAEQGQSFSSTKTTACGSSSVDQPGIRIMWRNEDDALRDLATEGWNIEGPFRMSPKKRGFRNLWFTGYGLTRRVH